MMGVEIVPPGVVEVFEIAEPVVVTLIAPVPVRVVVDWSTLSRNAEFITRFPVRVELAEMDIATLPPSKMSPVDILNPAPALVVGAPEREREPLPVFVRIPERVTAPVACVKLKLPVSIVPPPVPIVSALVGATVPVILSVLAASMLIVPVVLMLLRLPI
jgi:hypothetical protein